MEACARDLGGSIGPIHESSRLPASTAAMRQPHAATVVLLLWLAVLTVAFHGCGGRLGRGSSAAGSAVTETASTIAAAVPRKMLLDMTSFDAASSPSATDHHHHHHHHEHQHRHNPHRHHHHHHRWNQQGILPSAAGGNGEEDEIDPRYGVQKRLVPSGPNPLHH